MVVFSGSLFAAAFVFEMLAVALIVREMKEARRLAKSPNRNTWDGGNAAGGPTMEQSAGSVMDFLLESRAAQWWAVVLIVAGIICGTAGNFMTLIP